MTGQGKSSPDNPVRLEKKRTPKVGNYGEWLLVRLLAAVLLLAALSIPLTRYLMSEFEGRPVSYGEAAVFVVQSLTTVGYGELLPFTSNPMRVLSIVLMITGVTLIFMIGGTIVATLVERRVKPRAATEADLEGHVIFTRFNESVERIIDQLEARKIPYVIAERSEDRALELSALDYNAVLADPEGDDGLRRLSVETARLIVAAGDDAVNINVTLAAARLSDAPVLVVMESESRAEIARKADADRAVTPHAALGRELVDWVVSDPGRTEFLDLIDVAVSPKVLEKLKPSIFHVGSGNPISHQPLGSAQLRSHSGATVVGIWRPDGTVTKPDADTLIGESTLIVLGPPGSVERMAKQVGGAESGEHVVLVGFGRVGRQAGKELNRAGIRPVVIDLHARELAIDGRLIRGDATNPDLLKRARIEEADTLIVAMNKDSLAIFTILAALQLNPDLNVVARAEKAETVYRLERAGADHVLSKSMVGTQLLQLSFVKMGLLPRSADNLIREITAPGNEMTLKQLGDRFAGIRVIAVVRKGDVLQPRANFTLQRDDRLVVHGSREAITQFASATRR